MKLGMLQMFSQATGALFANLLPVRARPCPGWKLSVAHAAMTATI